ncbi:hypothetical protein BU16DRAFT_622276 [Lophium mytilinum]|uniref:Zinc-binding loop region of homing endonuclease domain-containing protein n=1 Tax=Lophium mytilinum TaxID=390894 RepID=A0A6A6QC94_9PEZI|nr:hypothetical protein BU16DRAFT_622276 [Lophium mytilinum]
MVSPVPVTRMPHMHNPASGKKRKRPHKEKPTEETIVESEKQEYTDASWSGITDDEDIDEEENTAEESGEEPFKKRHSAVPRSILKTRGGCPRREPSKVPIEQSLGTPTSASKPNEGRHLSSKSNITSETSASRWRTILQDRKAVERRKRDANKFTQETWEFFKKTKASFEEYVLQEYPESPAWDRRTIIKYCKEHVRMLPWFGVNASDLKQSKDALKYWCDKKIYSFSTLRRELDLEVTAQVEQTIVENKLEDSVKSENSTSEAPTPTMPSDPHRSTSEVIDLTMDPPDVQDEENYDNKHAVNRNLSFEEIADEQDDDEGDTCQVGASSPLATVNSPSSSVYDQGSPPNADESVDDLYRDSTPVEDSFSRRTLGSSIAYTQNVGTSSRVAAGISSKDRARVLGPRSYDSDERFIDLCADASDASMNESNHDEGDLGEDDDDDDEGPVVPIRRRAPPQMSRETVQHDLDNVPQVTTSGNDMQGMTDYKDYKEACPYCEVRVRNLYGHIAERCASAPSLNPQEHIKPRPCPHCQKLVKNVLGHLSHGSCLRKPKKQKCEVHVGRKSSSALFTCSTFRRGVTNRAFSLLRTSNASLIPWGHLGSEKRTIYTENAQYLSDSAPCLGTVVINPVREAMVPFQCHKCKGLHRIKLPAAMLIMLGCNLVDEKTWGHWVDGNLTSYLLCHNRFCLQPSHIMLCLRDEPALAQRKRELCAETGSCTCGNIPECRIKDYDPDEKYVIKLTKYVSKKRMDTLLRCPVSDCLWRRRETVSLYKHIHGPGDRLSHALLSIAGDIASHYEGAHTNET